jgi:hypothetical protein
MPKISALTAASAPDADDLLYIVEDGNSRKATVEQVGKAAINATGDAPIYACRAWVNFDGTGTVAIRASGNVSSVTDNGEGDYTVNFATAMPDANYATTGTSAFEGLATIDNLTNISVVSRATGSVRIVSGVQRDVLNTGALQDCVDVSVAIFR